MAHSHIREPVYIDDLDSFGGRHIPPPDRDPHRSHRRRRYEDDFGLKDSRPQRRHTYRQPKHYSSSESSSPPPPRARRHREVRESPPPPRRRRHGRDDDYFSDNRHNRPRNNPYAEERPPRDRRRDDRGDRDKGERREKRAAPQRKESKWQKEAKDMFKEYAVPVIKAEGGKILSQQIGNLIAKKAG